MAPLPIEILLKLFLERIRLPCDPYKTTKSMNSHQKTHEYIKGDSPLFTLECNELVNTHSVILMIFQI